MLLLVAQKLREDDELLRIVRDKFKFVFVDEYQDTNEVQLSILKSIVGHSGQITIVGDDDQTIYSCK